MDMGIAEERKSKKKKHSGGAPMGGGQLSIGGEGHTKNMQIDTRARLQLKMLKLKL